MRILLYASFKAAGLSIALAQALRRPLGVTRFDAVGYRASHEGYELEQSGEFAEVLTESAIYARTVAAGYPCAKAELERLEQRYGRPNLWPFLVADRRSFMTLKGWLYRHGSSHSPEEQSALLLQRFRETESFLDRTRPDLIVFASPDTGPSSAHVLKAVADDRGIPCLIPHRSRVASFVSLSTRLFNRLPWVEETYRRADELPSKTLEEAEALVADFGRGKARYFDPTRPSAPKAKRTPLERIAKGARNYMRRGYGTDPYSSSWLSRRQDDLIAKRRRVRLERLCAGHAPAGELGVFFPLHVQPEMSTLLFAPYFRDQVSLIRSIAQAAPANHRVWVKEHPVMIRRGLRDPIEIEAIRKIPNVRMVADDTHELLERSAGTVTITGTPALEAMMLGKPAITFGPVFFDFVEKLCWRIRDVTRLASLLQRLGDFEPDPVAARNLMAAIISEGVPVDLDRLQALSHFDPASIRGESLDRYVDYLVRSARRCREEPPERRVDRVMM